MTAKQKTERFMEVYAATWRPLTEKDGVGFMLDWIGQESTSMEVVEKALQALANDYRDNNWGPKLAAIQPKYTALMLRAVNHVDSAGLGDCEACGNTGNLILAMVGPAAGMLRPARRTGEIKEKVDGKWKLVAVDPSWIMHEKQFPCRCARGRQLLDAMPTPYSPDLIKTMHELCVMRGRDATLAIYNWKNPEQLNAMPTPDQAAAIAATIDVER